MNQVTALLMHLVAPGLWTASELSDHDGALAAAQGYPIVEVDLTGVSSKAAMMEALARDLGFGDYFGKNFDALQECLGDLSDDIRVIAIVNGSELVAADPQTVLTLNEVLGEDTTRSSRSGSGRSYVWIGVDLASRPIGDPAVPAIPNFWS